MMARKGNTLLLSARQARLPMVHSLAQAYQVQEFASVSRSLPPTPSCNHLGHDEIFQRREFGKQMMVLIHEANPSTPDCRSLPIAQARCSLAGDLNPTASRSFQKSCDVQESRFAGA